jgi:hypothetical protein
MESWDVPSRRWKEKRLYKRCIEAEVDEFGLLLAVEPKLT